MIFKTPSIAMDPKQGRNGPAVPRVSTCCQIERLQPLAFLEVLLTFHTAM
jgi:hypothetical protein